MMRTLSPWMRSFSIPTTQAVNSTHLCSPLFPIYGQVVSIPPVFQLTARRQQPILWTANGWILHYRPLSNPTNYWSSIFNTHSHFHLQNRRMRVFHVHAFMDT